MRLQNKLFLVSLAGSALLVGAMFLLMQWSVDRGMLDYVNTRETEKWRESADLLADFHNRSEGFDRLVDNNRLLQDVATGYRVNGRDRNGPGRPPPGRDGPRGNRGEHPPGRPGGHIPADRPAPVVLFATDGSVIAGHAISGREYQRLPIKVEENVVGYLGFLPRDSLGEGFELSFLQQQRETFVLISLLVLFAAALTSLPLARHLVAPLKKLAAASRQMASGDFTQRQDASRNDELGAVARGFNHLGETLEQNQSARKRWLADTSHELRTPLAIVRGELEAMLDDVRPLNRENLKSVHQEALHLGKLVDDLHELSNADIGAMRYQMEEVNLGELIAETCTAARTLFDDANVGLTLEGTSANVLVWGDQLRLNQLMTNLLVNTARYTDAGGNAIVSLHVLDSNVIVTIDDSAPGVPEESLSHLFDHLFRVEQSRSRNTGGSGLGLALCERIAQAHDGRILARHSSLGGLQVEIFLPLLTGR